MNDDVKAALIDAANSVVSSALLAGVDKDLSPSVKRLVEESAKYLSAKYKEDLEDNEV